MFKKFRESSVRFERYTLVFHSVSLISGIVAAAIIDGHADELLLIFPRAGYFSGSPLWRLYFFFLFVALSVALSVVTFWSQDRLRERNDQRRESAEGALLGRSDQLLEASGYLSNTTGNILEHQASEREKSSAALSTLSDIIAQANQILAKQDLVVDTVRTMPPSRFLNSYVKLLNQIVLVYGDLLVEDRNGQSVGELEDKVKLSIRAILQAVANIFQVYEGDSQTEASLASNLMIYVPRSRFSAEKMTEGPKKANMAFGSDGQWDALQGVLKLHPTLSARAGGDPAAADPDIDERYFPIPIDICVTADVERYHLLPGAPLAWFTKKSNSYPSPSAVLKWCDERAALTPDVRHNLEKYLEETKSVHSFVSIPFESTGNEPPIAVLNVHSSSPGLLSEKDEAILILMRPILEMLRRMLEYLSKLRGQAGKPSQFD